jgi:charged multivesicular body protein 5
MLYNQTYNLDQVAFASEGLKDAQQTVLLLLLRTLISVGNFHLDSWTNIQVFLTEQMTAMKAANKELKGMMKTVKLEDIDVSSILPSYRVSSCFQYSHLAHIFTLLYSFSFASEYLLSCDVQSMQDEMMDLMDVSNEIQETLGRSYNVPDDIDEEELMGGKAHIGSLIFLR